MNIDKMQAGREIDLLIDRELFGKKNLRAYHKVFTGRHIDSDRGLTTYQQSELDAGKYGPWEQCPAPHYSTDIAAAWQVVEKMNKRGFRHVISLSHDGQTHHARFISFNPIEEVYQAWENIAPLAICRAALKAVMGRDQD